MPDLTTAIAQHADLSEKEQKQAGKAIAGKMSDEHETFMKEVLRLIDTKQIDVNNPRSILKQDVYDKLSEEWQNKIDASLPNIIDQLRHIVDFRVSKKTPDESPQLQTMISYLWQMKQRIEDHHDVFKF